MLPPTTRCCIDQLNSPNALAEACNTLFKAGTRPQQGAMEEHRRLEIAVAEYIDCFNHRRLHGEIGLVPTGSPVCAQDVRCGSHGRDRRTRR